MVFFIRHRKEEFRVGIESRKGRLFVSINGGPEKEIDLEYYGNDCSFIRDGVVFAANVMGSRGEFTVSRPRGNLSLSVESEYKRIVSVLRGQSLGDESNIYAKMPGKVAKILTKEDNVVAKGESLLVIEAMKMENEICSSSAGKVVKICTKEGQAVETGTLLIEFLPAPTNQEG